ncbi:MAG: aminotransferase class III-fold pyridoxal phosphate-dependent enzyme, partial [Ruminococcus sp.]|nr:aminotransferase class III-fold pyridoxal phosphate-dependent enzyme [Ruminococcus sp.]
LARKYSFDKYGKEAERNIIITLENSFHGRTMATLSATGQEVFHNYFFPFLGGFVNVEANNVTDLLAKLEEYKGKVCAVMFEFVQGEGGVVSLKKDFVDAIFAECEKNDILTIADEVQTGVGRTGTLLTSEQYGVKPDITTLAKGLAGGLPIGVCLAGAKCCDTLTPSTHGSTFGGNPVCCAGGNAVLDKVLSEGFLDEVVQKGYYIWQKLIEHPEVTAVDGLGLMLGISLKTKKAGEVCKKCLENGLLVLTAKEKLRLLPPLTISYEEIDKGLEIITGLLNE